MLSRSHMANMKTKIFFVLDVMLKKNSFPICMKVGIDGELRKTLVQIQFGLSTNRSSRYA